MNLHRREHWNSLGHILILMHQILDIICLVWYINLPSRVRWNALGYILFCLDWYMNLAILKEKYYSLKWICMTTSVQDKIQKMCGGDVLSYLIRWFCPALSLLLNFRHCKTYILPEDKKRIVMMRLRGWNRRQLISHGKKLEELLLHWLCISGNLKNHMNVTHHRH